MSIFSRLTPNIVESNAQRINALYGGLDPNMTNVYFTHGQLDPWRAMGRQIDLNSEAPAVVIPRKVFKKYFYFLMKHFFFIQLLPM